MVILVEIFIKASKNNQIFALTRKKKNQNEKCKMVSWRN